MSTAGPRRARLAGRAAVAAHLVLGVPYLLSGLVVPLWAAIALWTVWTALLAVVVHQRRRRPLLAGLVPVAALVVWSTVVLAWLRLA